MSTDSSAEPTADTAVDPKNNTDNGSANSRFGLSNKIFGTLDPCVVKTKQWMEDYAHLWAGEEQQGIFSLAQGVVYWQPPPACRKALVDAVSQQTKGSGSEGDDDVDVDVDVDPLALHSYSPARGLPELLAALETKISVEHGMNHHDVTVTVGANQAYTNIVLTLLGDDEQHNKAVVFAPYYFNHVMAIQMCAGPDAVIVGPTDMATGVPDVRWLRETLSGGNGNDHGIRLVTLVNPGNPTGVALSREEVREIVDLCREHGVWVVLDCTYEHFFNTGESESSSPASASSGSSSSSSSSDKSPRYETNPLPTFPDDPHVIHVFSFSKGYALAGYRCGYLVTHKEDASGGQFLSQMLKVQDTIPIGPPRLTQHVALGALIQSNDGRNNENENDDTSGGPYSLGSKEWVYDKYDTLDASRNYILDALSSLSQQLGGSGSMYVMAKLPDDIALGKEEDDDETVEEDEPVDVVFCRRLVRDHGIAIIPGSFCGSPGWIRVCYANLPPDQTKLAAERLRKGIEELTRS